MYLLIIIIVFRIYYQIKNCLALQNFYLNMLVHLYFACIERQHVFVLSKIRLHMKLQCMNCIHATSVSSVLL